VKFFGSCLSNPIITFVNIILISKSINPVTGKEIDPMFDGHIEKPLSSMTPREKIDYLWLQMMFKWKIRNRVKKVLSHENDNQERSFS
jgi:hypothetical protein